MIEHFSMNFQTASNNILPAHTHMIRTYQMILWSDKFVLKLVVYWKTKDLVCIGEQFTARKKRRQNQREAIQQNVMVEFLKCISCVLAIMRVVVVVVIVVHGEQSSMNIHWCCIDAFKFELTVSDE